MDESNGENVSIALLMHTKQSTETEEVSVFAMQEEASPQFPPKNKIFKLKSLLENPTRKSHTI